MIQETVAPVLYAGEVVHRKTRKQHAWGWTRIVLGLFAVIGAGFNFFESRNVRVTSEKNSAALLKKMKTDTETCIKNNEKNGTAIAGVLAKQDFLEKALIATLHRSPVATFSESAESGTRALEAAAGEQAPDNVDAPIADEIEATPEKMSDLVQKYEDDGEDLLE